eukprot:TRINITY_DN23854_c0_g1_i2.p1 TRINITY_DN23854_c0_g1~~TRINITY_DN23854_c0_g1_i2.p1  ORF type:complete len:158 (+),score=43.75 TRINITY_DN23854_c0_g1_i2:96-569(+)
MVKAEATAAAKQPKAKKAKKQDGDVVETAEVMLKDRKGHHAAISYLRLWATDRDNWKFQKVRQTYLLQEWQNPYLVVKNDFKMLVKYLDGLKGIARATTLSQARKYLAATSLPATIVTAAEQAAKENDEAFDLATVTPVLLKVLHKRASKLIKVLAE